MNELIPIIVQVVAHEAALAVEKHVSEKGKIPTEAELRARLAEHADYFDAIAKAWLAAHPEERLAPA